MNYKLYENLKSTVEKFRFLHALLALAKFLRYTKIHMDYYSENNHNICIGIKLKRT